MGVGNPLDDFAAKFKDEFIRLGIPATMYVETAVQPGGGGISRLVRLQPGESPPTWDGDDPREELQGGEWKSQIGGAQFAGQVNNPPVSYNQVNNPQASYTQVDNLGMKVNAGYCSAPDVPLNRDVVSYADHRLPM